MFEFKCPILTTQSIIHLVKNDKLLNGSRLHSIVAALAFPFIQ